MNFIAYSEVYSSAELLSKHKEKHIPPKSKKQITPVPKLQPQQPPPILPPIPKMKIENRAKVILSNPIPPPQSALQKQQQQQLQNQHQHSLLSGQNLDPNGLNFPCPSCGKLFGRKLNLDRHFKTIHLGIKNHVCFICHKAFAKSWDLTLHMRTHTGEKPYSCPVCQQRFTQKGTLKKHVDTQHHSDEVNKLGQSSNDHDDS